jgi:hypothetical protein
MIKYKLGSPETEADSNPIIERFWPTKKLVKTQLGLLYLMFIA